MSEVNINFSVSNVPNVDRLHNETQRTPFVHIEQSAQKSIEEFSKIVEMPVEIEKMEKKSVNTEDRKLVENEKRKRKQERDNGKEKKNREKRRDNSAGIDFIA